MFCMYISSNNKDKDMFYTKMKLFTDYDSRWIDGNIVKYGKIHFKAPDEKTYNSRKTIIKYNQVDYEHIQDNEEFAENEI